MNTKERLERFLSDTPIKPVMRTHIDDVEVFVADGFVTPDMYLGLEIKFGIYPSRNEHPNGCYATVWHSEGKPAGLSGVGYFAHLHDIESVSLSQRQSARVNSMLDAARNDLRKMRRRKLNG